MQNGTEKHPVKNTFIDRSQSDFILKQHRGAILMDLSNNFSLEPPDPGPAGAYIHPSYLPGWEKALFL